MLKAIGAVSIAILCIGATPSPTTAPSSVFQSPYAPGEIDELIASSPTVEDLVRAMLVGDDPQRIDALVEAIAGPDASPLVIASR